MATMVSIDDDIAREANNWAKRTGRTLSQFVEDVIAGELVAMLAPLLTRCVAHVCRQTCGLMQRRQRRQRLKLVQHVRIDRNGNGEIGPAVNDAMANGGKLVVPQQRRDMVEQRNRQILRWIVPKRVWHGLASGVLDLEMRVAGVSVEHAPA